MHLDWSQSVHLRMLHPINRLFHILPILLFSLFLCPSTSHSQSPVVNISDSPLSLSSSAEFVNVLTGSIVDRPNATSVSGSSGVELSDSWSAPIWFIVLLLVGGIILLPLLCRFLCFWFLFVEAKREEEVDEIEERMAKKGRGRHAAVAPFPPPLPPIQNIQIQPQNQQHLFQHPQAIGIVINS